MPTAIVVTNEIEVMEITAEEKAMIEAKRAKDAHNALRYKYIEEMRELLERAKMDGFTFGAKKGTHAIHTVESWGDAAGNWIALSD
jgi:hypothetical protein